MELPKYNDRSRKGDDGMLIFSRIVRKNFSWIVRPNHQETDFGIDAYVDIVSERNFVTGKTIAVQVKTGESYFKEYNSVGWIYRGSLHHLNYYLNHQIPVVLILIDDINEKGFWVHCNPLKTERTGDNTWKITVPFKQELIPSAKEDLLRHVSPVKDYVSQLDNFWQLNNDLKEAERLIFMIDKSDILRDSYDEIIAGLDRIQLNPDLIEKLNGKLDILIHGYNDDERELPEIPEVKRWAQRIFESTEGLSYFLVIGANSNFFMLLKMCYMKYKRVSNKEFLVDGKKSYSIELDLTDKTFIKLAFHDLNKFTDKHGLSKDVNNEVSTRIAKDVLGIP